MRNDNTQFLNVPAWLHTVIITAVKYKEMTEMTKNYVKKKLLTSGMYNI